MNFDPLDAETIGKAFLYHLCTIDFEPYPISSDLPIKYKTERIQNHNRIMGIKIARFWREAAEATLQKKAEDFDPELLDSIAQEDRYGLLKAAAEAVKSTNYSKIGDTISYIYNTYLRERKGCPANPKVLPARIKKGLENLIKFNPPLPQQ